MKKNTTKKRIPLSGLLLGALVPWCEKVGAEEPPENFRTENLVAWCIVPFDAKKRGPAERAEMLVQLGLKRCAYDWRQEHVAEFEEEILQYKKQGIEYFAFWSEHPEAFRLFEKHGLKPQIWRTCPSPKEGTQEEKNAAAAEAMVPLAEKCAKLGSRLGLYNHGGWGGEPANLVAVCKHLHKLGHAHAGIVYNFHHGHGHLENFAESFAAMKPYLLCVNLNGMNDEAQPKILPVGDGKHETKMIREVIKSGYTGPIGILDHRNEMDAEESLRLNRDGLKKVLAAEEE